MPSQDMIDVRILVDGKPLREYRDPDTDLDDEKLRTRYIEVKTGQTFSVRIKLLRGFALRYAKYVAAVTQIDNHADTTTCLPVAADRLPSNHLAGGTLGDDYTLIKDWNSQTIWDEDVGEWAVVKWTFGALGANEKDPNTCDMTPEQISELGSIFVEVFRARREDGHPDFSEEYWKAPKAVDELPETVVKGSRVKSNTKFVTAYYTSAPTPSQYHYAYMNGKHGRPYQFKFLYRSKKILQDIGCIDRSPSPPPDTRLMLSERKTLFDKRSSKLLDFRLASFEAMSREGSLTVAEDTPSRPVKREGMTVDAGAADIKRSREDMEDGDELAEGALPVKKPRVIIDISGDSD